MGNHHEGEEDGNDGEEHAEKEEEKAEEDMLDGIPDWFVGPLIADLLRMKWGTPSDCAIISRHQASMTLRRSTAMRSKARNLAGSVMDYLPVNMNLEGFGEEQGDYGMIEVGPYDLWAIEYGYSIVKKDDELKSILARVNDPFLAYATDEDTYGPDPFARRYDFGKDPINYAKSQIKLANDHRAKILDEFVKDGESWAKARYGYGLTLSLQMRSLSMMANWLGGALINRSKKGDPDAGPPIEVVSANRQREALQFVMAHAFEDKAYGLTPELLRHLPWTNGSMISARRLKTADLACARSHHGDAVLGSDDAHEPHHDGAGLRQRVLNPADEDMITLPEILGDIRSRSELENAKEGAFTARKPMIPACVATCNVNTWSV